MKEASIMKKVVLAMILTTMASSVMAQGYSQPGNIGDPEYRTTVKPNLGHYPTEDRYDPTGHRLDARSYCVRQHDPVACLDYYSDRYGKRNGHRYYNPYEGQDGTDFVIGRIVTEILR